MAGIPGCQERRGEQVRAGRTGSPVRSAGRHTFKCDSAATTPMVELSCHAARPGGVTLVAVRLDNRVEAPGVEAHRVRLVSRVDGPTWPPRVEGVPAAPWDGDAAEVVVPTGTVGSLGFASPAPPVEPPVEVESVEPADEASDDPTAATAGDVLRVLGDPAPPRDAVLPASAATEQGAATDSAVGTDPAAATHPAAGTGPGAGTERAPRTDPGAGP